VVNILGQYPPMHPQQQQALYQHHQQQYPGAPPSYDQAMSHPMPSAAHAHAHAMQQAQNWVKNMPKNLKIIERPKY
jgi:truncated hemoglobin YjbI